MKNNEIEEIRDGSWKSEHTMLVKRIYDLCENTNFLARTIIVIIIVVFLLGLIQELIGILI